MRGLVTTLQWIAILLVIIQFLIWGMSYGSGHNISVETDRVFLRNIIVLALIAGLLFWWKRARMKDRNN
jgi:hypothetical protein